MTKLTYPVRSPSQPTGNISTQDKPPAKVDEKLKKHPGRRRSMSVGDFSPQIPSTEFSCRLEDFVNPQIKGRTWAYLSLYPEQQKKVQEIKKGIITKQELALFVPRRNELFFEEIKYRLCCQIQKLLNNFIAPAYTAAIKTTESLARKGNVDLFSRKSVEDISSKIKKHFRLAIPRAIDSKLMGHELMLDKIKNDENEDYTQEEKEKLREDDERTQERKFRAIVGHFQYNNLPEPLKPHLSQTEYEPAFNEFYEVVKDIDNKLRDLRVQIFSFHESQSIPDKIAETFPKVYYLPDIVLEIWSRVVSEKVKGFYGNNDSVQTEKIKKSVSVFSNLGTSIRTAIINVRETPDEKVFVRNIDNDIEKLCIGIFIDLSFHDSNNIVGAANWVIKNQKQVDLIIKKRVVSFAEDKGSCLPREKTKKCEEEDRGITPRSFVA